MRVAKQREERALPKEIMLCAKATATATTTVKTEAEHFVVVDLAGIYVCAKESEREREKA